MRSNIWLVLSTTLAAFVLTSCGSSGETVVVTERPEPVREQPTVAPGEEPVETPFSPAGDPVAFPAGRMWTFDEVPLDYLEETYGFRPGPQWLEQVRLAALRLPNCSAAFVSQAGLVVTNHHCVRRYLADLREPGENLATRGFVAESRSAERRAEDLFADQLLGIEDVTERVHSRTAHIVDDDRRADVRRRTMEALEAELTAAAKQRDTTRHVQVVELYSGARYAAYEFRRIHDLRLVLAPEESAAAFGGDVHNFSYPRFTLDVAFLRAYDVNGTPLENEAHFEWSEEGVEEGDAVFTAGNPGETLRLRTRAQLAFERDFTLPRQIAILNTRAAVLEQFIAQEPALADSFDVRNSLRSIRNVQKDLRGRLEALRNDSFLRRIGSINDVVPADVGVPDTLAEAHRQAVRSIEAIQRTRRATANQAEPFAMFGSEQVDSHILIRAVYAFLYDFARQRGVGPSSLESYREAGRAVDPLPRALEEQLLAARLRELQEGLGAADPNIRTVMGGRSPEDVAANITRGTALVDSAGFDSLIEAGYLASGDPTVELAEAIVPLYLTVAQQRESLASREARAMARIAEIRREHGESFPPEGTFSLRLSDGVVSGYSFSGTRAPAYTTFHGMYNAHFSYPESDDFDLPERWIERRENMELGTPLNFVSTIDLTGGSSGSPVFTADLSLVGIAFDSNFEALAHAYLFLEEAGRAIAVDTRGVGEALRRIYGAEVLLQELQTGISVAPAD